MPKFTKTGYKKMKIPKELFKVMTNISVICTESAKKFKSYKTPAMNEFKQIVVEVNQRNIKPPATIKKFKLAYFVFSV